MVELKTVISRKTPKSRRPIEKKIYAIHSSLRKTPFVLTKTKKFTIGRAGSNSACLKEKTISAYHASIKWEKSAFKIRDANSTNGTFLNGKRIMSPCILKDKDKIRIGKYVLVFRVTKVREKARLLGGKTAKKKTGKQIKKV